MLNRTLVAALLVGTGVAGTAFAQTVTTDTYKVYALNDGRGQLVRERVIETNPTVIERTYVIGPAYHIPARNTGVSRINGGVGGAMGGYYIVGSVPSENRSLYIPRDAYQH